MVKQLAARYFAQMIEYRRYIHQNPELSGHEKETARYICQVLDQLAIPYRRNISGYGIVALLRGEKGEGKTVALRADMDALPIQEVSDKPYRSRVDGVSHACGHDVHVACLLGALHILNDLKSAFGGTVKAIFQPSEEEYEGGAKFMIADGVLEDVDVIYGLHVTPGIETGQIGVRSGAMMASTDELHLQIIGKGGHAALPDEVVNPIEMGIDIIREIENFTKNNNTRQIPTVLTFGRFIAEGKANVIPGIAKITGTLRTFDEGWRAEVLQQLKKITDQVADQYGGKVISDIRNGYPVLKNDEKLTKNFIQIAKSFLGDENVTEIPPRMTAEDFAYYLQKKPGVFFRLGTSNMSQNITQKLHTADFDIDERAMEVGAGLLAEIIMNDKP
ncbi:M20 family metallopeptidase [Bacteroidales bacterium OttesenSCG-928-E04]|nr:M20 family metallopeptidase [Bacteroidales bacterium OttesenSCG-928-E04]